MIHTILSTLLIYIWCFWTAAMLLKGPDYVNCCLFWLLICLGCTKVPSLLKSEWNSLVSKRVMHHNMFLDKSKMVLPAVPARLALAPDKVNSPPAFRWMEAKWLEMVEVQTLCFHIISVFLYKSEVDIFSMILNWGFVRSKCCSLFVYNDLKGFLLNRSMNGRWQALCG